MVKLMYALPEGDQYKRGYKAPVRADQEYVLFFGNWQANLASQPQNDIRSEAAMNNIRTYWPDIDLIIGVRHPVKWFESYYNYNSYVSFLFFPFLVIFE